MILNLVIWSAYAISTFLLINSIRKLSAFTSITGVVLNAILKHFNAGTRGEISFKGGMIIYKKDERGEYLIKFRKEENGGN